MNGKIALYIEYGTSNWNGGMLMYFISHPFVAYPYFPHYAYHLPQNNGQFPSHTSLQLQNQFPPVNTKKLHSSAEKIQEIMREARLLIDKIVNSPDFSSELMNAAQLSDKKKVEELIFSTGVMIKVHTIFTPTGIQIEFDSSETRGGCCKLNMGLLW